MLVSAVISDGPPSRVVEQAVDGQIELVVPVPVVVELERVLRGKLGFDDLRWAAVARLLDELAPDRPAAPAVVEAVTGDPADDIVLACAVEARVDVLVTGDRKHLLPVVEHHGVRIVTPQALLRELG